jgi:hypothetical protein
MRKIPYITKKFVLETFLTRSTTSSKPKISRNANNISVSAVTYEDLHGIEQVDTPSISLCLHQSNVTISDAFQQP